MVAKGREPRAGKTTRLGGRWNVAGHFTSITRIVLAAILLGAAVTGSAPALADSELPGVGAGRVVPLPDGQGDAELVRIDESLVESLLSVPFEETVWIAAWPLAPALRSAVRLTRHDIYSPEARIWRIDGERYRGIQASTPNQMFSHL